MTYTYKRKGQSTKPCHGCGSTLPHWSDKVCDQCAAAIKGYNAIMAERAAAGDMVEMISKERAYALPNIYDCPSDQRNVIQNCVLKITDALSTPVVGGWPNGQSHIFDFKNQDRKSDFSTIVRIRPEHAGLLRELYAGIQQAIAMAYKNGHQDGRNLLASLASGEITSDGFNDTVLRKEK